MEIIFYLPLLLLFLCSSSKFAWVIDVLGYIDMVLHEVVAIVMDGGVSPEIGGVKASGGNWGML